ncbi:MAG: hypothetical protein AABZ06_02355 [Bdellovibrionota bacterium]
MTKKIIITALTLVTLTASPDVFGVNSVESTFGVGLTFYSGTPGEALTPKFSPQVNYSANTSLFKDIDIINRFEFGMLLVGNTFGSISGSYNGVAGSYELGTRINIGKKNIIVSLEPGFLLGIFEIFVPSASSGYNNQTSMKYGYILSAGADKYKQKGRGGAGWGISASFFKYLASPSNFEFQVGSVSASGVKIDIRFHLGSGGN